MSYHFQPFWTLQSQAHHRLCQGFCNGPYHPTPPGFCSTTCTSRHWACWGAGAGGWISSPKDVNSTDYNRLTSFKEVAGYFRFVMICVNGIQRTHVFFLSKMCDTPLPFVCVRVRYWFWVARSLFWLAYVAFLEG